MASIVREAVINAPSAHCWDAVLDFGALSERLARGFITASAMTGARERAVTFFTGAVATEMLIGTDEDAMRLAYTVTDGPLKAAHYNASVQIVPVDGGRCRFVWIVDVLPDELGGRIGELMDAGLTAIRATLEASAEG